MQSLLVAACLGLTKLIRLVPSAVLWGYFAFMALESLSGSQFWERLLYMITDPSKRHRWPHDSSGVNWLLAVTAGEAAVELRDPKIDKRHSTCQAIMPNC